MDEIFFDIHALWKCPFSTYHANCILCRSYSNVAVGTFPHLEHIFFLDGPLPRPVSDVLLPDVIDVFTASIGNCLVYFPRRKTCFWWTISDCQIHVTVLSWVKSTPSICSRSDNLLLWTRATRTHVFLISSSWRAPKLQYLANAYMSSPSNATGSSSSCLHWKNHAQSKTIFFFFKKYASNLQLTVAYEFRSSSVSLKESMIAPAFSLIAYKKEVTCMPFFILWIKLCSDPINFQPFDPTRPPSGWLKLNPPGGWQPVTWAISGKNYHTQLLYKLLTPSF